MSAGVRTIIDLRNDDEVGRIRDAALARSRKGMVPSPSAPPPELQRVRVPIDDTEDVEFWQEIRAAGLDGTPLYVGPFIRRKAYQCAAAVRAIAAAESGGVIFHCQAGRDRTGIVALLMLSLAGVEPSAIAADYALSGPALTPLFASLGMPDQTDLIDKMLRQHGTTTSEAIMDALRGLDVTELLRNGGLSDDELEAARSRLV